MANLKDTIVFGKLIATDIIASNKDLLAEQLILETKSGEGGQVQLKTALSDKTTSGIVIDTANGDFRIFGLPSRDGVTRTGNGTVLTIDPYDKTIAGGYSFSGGAATFSGKVAVTNTEDADAGKSSGAFTVGAISGQHLAIDGNEIMSKSNASTAATLYLNNQGGLVQIGSGGLTVSGIITGTLSGSATSAGQISDITESDKASNSATKRRIWFAYSNNTTGRPAYDDRFTIQTSTGTLFAPSFSGNLSGNVTGTAGGLNSSVSSIELNSGGTLASYGGFIDFHFHNASKQPTNDSGTVVSATPDYTSRIIENAPGQIAINGVTIKRSTITGTLSGNASSATGFASAKTITLTGNVTGSANGGNGSNGWSISTTVASVPNGALPLRLRNYQPSGFGTANEAVETGFHYITGAGDTNRPAFGQSSNKDYRILTTAYSDIWLQQIATDFRCNDIFYRRKEKGSWKNWIQLLTSEGGTLNGLLKAHGGIALNSSTAQSTGLTYILGIKAFAEGGNIVWSSASDVSVKYATSAGSATTATKLQTARTISLTGSVTGSGSFDGSGNLSIATTINYGDADPTASTPGYGTNGALYFKIIG